MSEHNTSRAIRYLPQVAVATMAVAVVPVVVVWFLHDRGTISSAWLCMGLAIALSLGASAIGSAYWKRYHGAGDIFFSELLLWGWLHRLRGERRLAKTAGLLGLGDSDEASSYDLTASEGLERTARLLREMAAALDAQDPYTDGHSRRVALHSAMVARKMGLERDEIAKVRTAAAIHDIGKLRIPLELLNKPGELSDEEFEVIKRHPDEGAAIVACMEDPEITAMVRHHHERFDGGGYPSGLTGEQTPLGARIIAVADTFDALTSIRPYRTAISHKRALQSIVGVAGTQLDPVVVRAFIRCYDANRAILFWTLFAASPQRALAWLGGRAPGRANLASAATIAMPAALAAVVATAFSTASGVATAHPPLRLAQQTVPKAGDARLASQHRVRRSAVSPRLSRRTAVASKHAVLGVRRSRGALAGHLQRGAGGTSGSGSVSGASPGGGAPTGPPPGGTGGTSSTTSATYVPPPSGSGPPLAVTAPTATVSAPTAPTTSAPPTAGGSGGTPTPAAGGTGGDPGGGTTTGSPAGGTGGNQGGNGGNGGTGGSGGGGSSGSGSGSGSGSSSGGGSGGPPNKDACKNGGYIRYHFPNQGQCVAYVEHTSPH